MLTQGNNKLKPYGYQIFGCVIFSIEDRVLLNISKDSFSRVELRSTMSNFLNYLLENAEKGFISDDEVMAEVWEANNLMASTNRLWQVSKDLRYKLMDIGIDQNLYNREKRKGFVVQHNEIVPIFKKTTKGD